MSDGSLEIRGQTVFDMGADVMAISLDTSDTFYKLEVQMTDSPAQFKQGDSL